MYSKSLIGLLLGFAMTCQAEQRLVVQEGENGVARISTLGLNRIAVFDDRIVSVKGLVGQFQMDKDLKLGQIFIQPTTSDKEDPIHLYMTTEKGFTYGLSLISTGLPPENIVLVPSVDHSPEKEEQFNDHEMRITQLIKAIHNQQLPKDYAVEKVNKKMEDLYGATVIHRATYKGLKFQAESYEITNHTYHNILLRVCDFYRSDVCAIVLLHKNVKPSQQTVVYIVRK